MDSDNLGNAAAWVHGSSEEGEGTVKPSAAPYWKFHRRDPAVLADPAFEHQVLRQFYPSRIGDAHEAVESGKLIGNIDL